MNRVTKDEYYLDIAYAVCKRSNCIKRHYGAVIVKNDKIIATGYNGSPRGEVNCCDLGMCKRLYKPSNSGDYADCHSVHAEMNALLQANRDELEGSTLYLAGEEFNKTNQEQGDFTYNRLSDCSPCPICDRMIRNSGIEKVITRS